MLAVMTVLLCAVDLLLLRGRAAGEVGTIAALGAHYATASAITLAGLGAGGRRRATVPGWAATAFLLGPFGGPILAIGLLPAPASGSARGAPEPPVATDAATRLADSLRDGRRRRDRSPPPSFADAFASGDVPLQQRMIGAISRRYRPEMREALSRALASDVPAIRVQAAAVHARLRGRFEAAAKAMLDAGAAPDAREAADVAGSGFLNPAVRTALLGLPIAGDPHATPPRPPEARPPRLKRHACGGIA